MATDRFCVSGQLGVDLDRVDVTQQFRLGSRVVDNEGGQWLYCLTTAIITGPGYACLLTNTTFTAAMINLTTSATARGQLFGFPSMAFASGEYGWFQVGGPCDNIRVLASAVAHVKLNTTATDGALDDDATVGSENVDGVVIDVTAGGAAATVAGNLVSDASVGATL